MDETWLVLDCNYLCYRSFHAFGSLSHDGKSTSVVFGFLRDVVDLQQLFGTNKICFAWDYGKGIREQVFPGYKQSRRTREAEMSPEELEEKAQFRQQVADLRSRWLWRLGYRNILYHSGYEADDVIASVCKTLGETGARAIIVSSDHDLYQLLSPAVSIYNPAKKETITDESFRTKWKIMPEQWIEVKATAGCSSDDIPGVSGVGEVYAAKYVRGELTKGVKYDAIVNAQKTIRRNIKLVTLPYPGCHEFILQPDETTPTRWRKVMDSLGIRSIRPLGGQ